jgi:hypothetical protein
MSDKAGLSRSREAAAEKRTENAKAVREKWRPHVRRCLQTNPKINAMGLWHLALPDKGCEINSTHAGGGTQLYKVLKELLKEERAKLEE